MPAAVAALVCTAAAVSSISSSSSVVAAAASTRTTSRSNSGIAAKGIDAAGKEGTKRSKSGKSNSKIKPQASRLGPEAQLAAQGPVLGKFFFFTLYMPTVRRNSIWISPICTS